MRTLYCLVGPTCTGKSTIEKYLNAHGMPSVVSFTTRAPRAGEINGKDYYFKTKEEVEALLATKRGVAQYVHFRGNTYGTSLEALDFAFAASEKAVVVVEPTGVTQYQAYAAANPEVGLTIVPVYIGNGLETLVSRLTACYRLDVNGDPAYYWARMMGLEQEQAEWANWPGIKWDLYFYQHDDHKCKGMSSTPILGQAILQHRARK